MFERRLIGIDYGTRRIGISCSDLLRITAQPLQTLVVSSRKEIIDRVCEVLAGYDVELVIVGLPKSLAGGGGKMAEEVRKFTKGLEKRGYKTQLVDERFSSRQAMQTMRAAGKSEKQMRGKTDSIAAQIILQTYLDSNPPPVAE